MVMNLHDVALVAAGVIGSAVAVAHGIIVQRHMVRRLEKLSVGEDRMPTSTRRVMAGMLHFSTFNWFFGGVALVAAATWLEPGARYATGLIVGSSYLYGAVGNFWGTRGRSPGWILYAIALALIAYGVNGSGG
jgi:hypothetical protein